MNIASILVNGLREAVQDWVQHDLPAITYTIKFIIAGALAVGISLILDLEQPKTALITVALVMHFRSSMVISKSVYRLLGTICGILASLILVAMFAQERIPFLICMALWVGICTAGSMVFRNYQAYGFVLSGYTICMVGIPATIAPAMTFDIASTRLSEIMVGLASAALVSELLFPQSTWVGTLTLVRTRFIDFCNLIRITAAGDKSAELIQHNFMKFVGDIFNLDAFKAAAGVETDQSRSQRATFNQLNNEFMEASTTFHTFNRLLQRTEQDQASGVGQILHDYYYLLGNAITINGQSGGKQAADTATQMVLVDRQLRQFREYLNMELTQSNYYYPAFTQRERLAYTTGVQLLQRLVDELHAYSEAHRALTIGDRNKAQAGLTEKHANLTMHFDWLPVALAGIRGAITASLISAIWIYTDWPSGPEAIVLGTITSTLFASAAAPTQVIKNFIKGVLIGITLAYWVNFNVLVGADDYLTLMLAISPGLLLVGWLAARPTTALIGTGAAITYILHLGFGTSMANNPITFFNDSIADLLAVLVSGVMYSLIDLSSSNWARNRTIKTLRKLVIDACSKPLSLERLQFEVSARDLVYRSGSIQRGGQKEDGIVVEQLLSSLELGHVAIRLRETSTSIPHPLKEKIELMLKDLAGLLTSPAAYKHYKLIYALNKLIDDVLTNSDDFLSDSQQKEIATNLNLILSILSDERFSLVTVKQAIREQKNAT